MSKERQHIMEKAKQTWFYRINSDKIQVPTHIVIKVTPHCNMNCVYCYSNNNAEYCQKIDPSYVVKLLDEIFEVGNKYGVTCVFHGGEPLLCIDTIKTTIDLLKQKYYYNRLSFQIQTNGTLIDENNIEFIAANFRSVGVSLDGIKDINDKTRFYHNTVGTFNDVVRGINLLRKHGVKYGILSVATKNNIMYLTDLVKWCINNNIYSLGIEPLLFSGRGEMCRSLQISAEDYWIGMRKLLDYVIEYNSCANTQERIYIRDFETVIQKIMGYPCTYMCADVPCGAGTEHLSLNFDGKIYICDTFTNREEYCIGDIKKDKLLDMIESPIIKAFSSRSSNNIEKCRNCDMKSYCLSGCIGKTMCECYTNNLNSISPLCHYYYSLAAYLLKAAQNGFDLSILTKGRKNKSVVI